MIRREASIFLVVGLLTVGIDFGTYRALLYLGIEHGPAKAVGFIVGTIFAYFANRIWTFGQHQHESGSAVRFVVLYTLTLGANVLVNGSVLALLNGRLWPIQTAFICATAVSAALNFLGMKFFVFRKASLGRQL